MSKIDELTATIAASEKDMADLKKRFEDFTRWNLNRKHREMVEAIFCDLGVIITDWVIASINLEIEKKVPGMLTIDPLRN
jgi:hypothetical protein